MNLVFFNQFSPVSKHGKQLNYNDIVAIKIWMEQIKSTSNEV